MIDAQRNVYSAELMLLESLLYCAELMLNITYIVDDSPYGVTVG
jgi:hypothetical protein